VGIANAQSTWVSEILCFPSPSFLYCIKFCGRWAIERSIIGVLLVYFMWHRGHGIAIPTEQKAVYCTVAIKFMSLDLQTGCDTYDIPTNSVLLATVNRNAL